MIIKILSDDECERYVLEISFSFCFNILEFQNSALDKPQKANCRSILVRKTNCFKIIHETILK